VRLILTTGFQAISGRLGSVTQGMVGMARKSPGSAEYTAFARAGFNPTNPQSSQQIAIRALLSASSTAYKSLTVSEADAWEVLGAQMSVDGPVGSWHGLTGIQAYNQVNVWRLMDGQAQTTAAPEVSVAEAPTITDVVSDGANLTGVRIQHSEIAGSHFGFRLTAARTSAVRKAAKGELRFISTDFASSIIESDTSPQIWTVPSPWSAPIGQYLGIEVTHLAPGYLPSGVLFLRSRIIEAEP